MQDGNGRKAKLEKAAIMYVWQFGINGYTIMGRTWGEFVTMMQTVSEVLGLNDKLRLIVYVHNLSYEFQFCASGLSGNGFSVLICASRFTQ